MTSETSSSESKGKNNLRRRIRRNINDYDFSYYLSFNSITTCCIFIFLIIYIIVLLIVSPLLRQVQQQEKQNEISIAYDIHHTHNSIMKHGDVLRPVLDNLKHLAESEKEYFEKVKHDGYINTIKKKILSFRNEKNISDQSLIDVVEAKMNQIREQREQKQQEKENNNNEDQQHKQQQLQQLVSLINNHQQNQQFDTKKRNGFIVLGMHRSGTSMLSGLLVNGLGYNVGGPLIGSAFDNEKGFFELISVVLQNDEFMNQQHVWWSTNVLNYKDNIALQDNENHKIKFKYGKQALNFFNDPNNVPYIQKDPRMCITLKTWLPLLDNEPAIVFTYRHPIEVAHSLMKREQGMTLEHSIRLWIIYNMRAIQNMKGLCIIYSSNEDIMSYPFNEVQRISNELTYKCNVPTPSQKLTQDIVDKFVDPNLQHNKNNNNNKEDHNDHDHNTGNKKIIAKYNNDTCIVYEFDTISELGSRQYEIEEQMYLKAMEIFCNLKNGYAYKDEYVWPDRNWFVSLTQ